MSYGLTDVSYGVDARQGIAQPYVDAHVVRKLYGLRRHVRRDRTRIVRKYSRLVQNVIEMEREGMWKLAVSSIDQDQCQSE